MNIPKKSEKQSISRNQRGATIIMVALMLFVLVGFAALAVDLGLLYVAKNELQNAADAGALAGARVLYNEDGTAVNPGANQEAYDAATANKSWKVPVDINWPGDDTQRGHWCFGIGDLARGFYPNEEVTDPPDLWDVSTEELDADTDFINAVRVVARRQATPIVAFFSRIFGYESYQLSADAVAYIGFAGTLTPEAVDQPIAICEQAIENENDEYTCNVGRMINSGSQVAYHETGGWTDFNQEGDPCAGGTNASTVKPLVDAGCPDGGVNEYPIEFDKDMATSGGEIQSAFNKFYDCWQTNSDGGTKTWELTLPVISCEGNNVGTCEAVQGAVTVNIIWINDTLNESSDLAKRFETAPTSMTYPTEDGTEYWEYLANPGNTNGFLRWQSFVDELHLQDVTGWPDEPSDDDYITLWKQKTIYFLPDCTPHKPTGTSGGKNFGILAKIPVLVE